ncbi:MAG: triacylglycerol lipase [Pseudomonadales bacterium]|nr:triacylglycerol lipase [Pseudomonadales bacterium]
MKPSTLIKSAVPLCLAATLSMPAQAGWLDWLFKDTYTETRHPIVLIHGMFGFDDVVGVDYFYQVADELSRSGAEVYTIQVSALNSTEVRGEQAWAQIQDIIATSGADKVNIIGHSHGGPTARYVASLHPDTVASVSSVAGVNWGSAVADVYRQYLEEGSAAGGTVAAIGNAFGDLITWASSGDGLPQDLDASIDSLTTEGSVAFNAQYPEGMPGTYCGEGNEVGSNGVRYYSWSGASSFTGSYFDILDYISATTSLAFDEPNDGLVSSCSSHLGKVIRDDYDQTHFDEINQLMGMVGSDDPIPLYRNQANRLKNLGL